MLLIYERSGSLDEYLFFHSTRPELLRRVDRQEEGRLASLRALELAGNAAERRFLQNCLLLFQ
jgi:RNA polymerase sigma-70 factor, ECF subfamily